MKSYKIILLRTLFAVSFLFSYGFAIYTGAQGSHSEIVLNGNFSHAALSHHDTTVDEDQIFYTHQWIFKPVSISMLKILLSPSLFSGYTLIVWQPPQVS